MHTYTFLHHLLACGAFVLLLGGGLYVLRRRGYFSTIHPRLFVASLAAQLLLSLLFSALHTGALPLNYAGDSELYYNSISGLWQLLLEQPARGLSVLVGWGRPEQSVVDALQHQVPGIYNSRALNFTRLALPLYLLGGGSFWATGLWLALLSWVVRWRVYQLLQARYRHQGWPLAVAVLFLPQVLFWSGGLLKEALLIPAGYGLLALVLTQPTGHLAWLKRSIGVAACLLVILALKPFLLWVLLPVGLVVILLWLALKSSLAARTRWLAGGLLLLGVLAWVQQPVGLYRLQLEIEWTQELGQAIIRHSPESAGGYFSVIPACGPWYQLFAYAPAGAYIGLFGPLPWQAGRITTAILALHQLLVLGFMGFVVHYYSRRYSLNLGLLPVLLLAFALSYGTLQAYTTTFWGTLFRYQVLVQPFFVVGVLLLFQPRFKAARI